MTDHRIRIQINPSGILCGTCDRAVQWVRDDFGYRGAGYWQHVDPAELAASMRRHPSGRDL